jgi:hypothetical protein
MDIYQTRGPYSPGDRSIYSRADCRALPEDDKLRKQAEPITLSSFGYVSNC